MPAPAERGASSSAVNVVSLVLSLSLAANAWFVRAALTDLRDVRAELAQHARQITRLETQMEHVGHVAGIPPRRP